MRRFYTLTPHVLYYGDSEGGDPVGAVLIKPDLQLSTRAEADGSSCLVLSSPNIQSVSLAGVDPEDTRVWRTHLSEALRLAHATVHSMLTVRYGSGTWHEWFCVLRKNGIDCHQSPLHTPSGSIPVTAQCDIDWDDTELTFYLVRSVGQGVKKGIFVKVRGFARNGLDAPNWLTAGVLRLGSQMIKSRVSIHYVHTRIIF